MSAKRSISWLILILVGAAGLLFWESWHLSTPRSSTADAFSFDSPIPPTGEPKLRLTKTINNDAPKAGDEIVYTLTYSNTNPGSQASNVRLYDFLPAGLQFLSSDPAADILQDGVILFSAPSVGPETNNVQVTVRGRVKYGYEQLHNRALILADGVTASYAALMTAVTQPPASLRLIKTGYTAVLANDELVYTLISQNTGDATANAGTLIDVLPSGLSLVSATPPPDAVTLPALTWSLGDLAAGERRTVTITTTAPASLGVIYNTALADARQQVVTQTVFATQVISQGAILRVTKQASAPAVDPGDELVYTLQYENAGNEIATGVRLTDTFPADIDVNAVSLPALSLTDQQGVWTFDELIPGAAGQIVISTTVGGKGGRTLLNVVDITGPAGSFPGHAELETDVRAFLQYLPVIMRDY